MSPGGPYSRISATLHIGWLKIEPFLGHMLLRGDIIVAYPLSLVLAPWAEVMNPHVQRSTRLAHNCEPNTSQTDDTQHLAGPTRPTSLDSALHVMSDASRK
jgi:hypothetical protein